MARKPPFKYVPLEERPEFIAQVAQLADVPVEQFADLARQCADRYHDAVLAGQVEALDQVEAAYTALVYQLNGGTLFACRAHEDSAGHVLARAVAATPGQVPRWGRTGEFLVEVEGMRIRVVITPGHQLGNHQGVDLHAVDLDLPFLSETGYRTFVLTVTNCLGLTVDEAVRTAVLDLLENEGKPKPIKVDARVRTHPTAPPRWLVDALAGVASDGQLNMFGDAPKDPDAKAPMSNAERQRALRKRRKELQLKPVLLTEAEKEILLHMRADIRAEQQVGEYDVRPIVLSRTDRCVLSLGILAHEDLDHRPKDWETSKKPGFDALLHKLWPEVDDNRYLAEPNRSTYRPSAFLRNEVERQRGMVERLEGYSKQLRAEAAALGHKVVSLERANALEIADRAKAFEAVEVLTERLRRAGLPTDYRKQPGE